ncbi:MAG: lipopolysaccharide kinase InaA family protein [Planctomycetota bacterium]|jgi:hypothetical protein|nr:lipopolysaccharide kinase InaA family protein [Planctomycetota bacterium]
MTVLPSPREAAVRFREALAAMGRLSRANWRYAVPGFGPALAHIFDNPAVLEGAEAIHRGMPNVVHKLTLPEAVGGYAVVVKRTLGRRQIAHWFYPTSCSREAAFYKLCAWIGVPTADFLAVGDSRTGWHWDYSFTVTRFLDGFADGEVVRDDLRIMFARKAVGYLGSLHRIRLYHRAFKPKNIMWREAGKGDVEIRLIDFGSCALRPRLCFTQLVVKDLAKFLRGARLKRDEYPELADAYLGANPGAGMSVPELLRRLDRELHRRSG